MTTSLSAEEQQQIQREFAALQNAANQFLTSVTPALDNMKGHIQTDIAGASAIAGSTILRVTVPDLAQHPTGTMILSNVHDAQGKLTQFMIGIARGMGIDLDGWNFEIPTGNDPHFDVIELIGRLQKPFQEIAARSGVQNKFHPLIAGLTAVKLVGAAHKMKILDQAIGKTLITHFVVLGTKTVPPPL